MIRRIAREICARIEPLAGPCFTLDRKSTFGGDDDDLETTLRDVLYTTFYVRPQSVADPGETPAGGLVSELRAANGAPDRREDGWAIAAVLPHGSVVAHRDGLHRTFSAGDYTTRSRGVHPAVGDAISPFFANDSSDLDEHFYFAFATTATDASDWMQMTRVYFNVESAGAAMLLAFLTERLTRYFVPYRIKCPKRPGDYGRADALVLYFPRSYWAIVGFLIAALPEKIRTHVRPEVPLFTKPLFTGIALAEHPPSGGSFGMHRCRLLAGALVQAWQQGIVTPRACAVTAEGVFRKAGIDPDKPYLNEDSVDIYADVALEAPAG